MTVHPTFVADLARGCAERADRDRGGVAAEGRRRQQGIGSPCKKLICFRHQT